MKDFPYLIYAPDYRPSSAGAVVLHKLGQLLNERGQEAYITAAKTNPVWNLPGVADDKVIKLIRRGAIGVYPEVVDGNPLRARTVVRYILNNPGLLGGQGKYHKNDILFANVEQLLQSGMPADRVLNIPVVNTDIFYQAENIERDIEGLLYLGKYTGVRRGEFFDKYVIISRNSPDQKTLGDWLRRCQILYTYDNFTILIYEATLCGCLVVIIPDGFRKREDLEMSEYGFNGVAWGWSPAEIARAKATLAKAPGTLKNIEKKQAEQLANFIRLTQAAASRRKRWLII